MRLKASKNKKAESPIELYTSVPYNLMDYFEWDENKRLLNVKKHDLDFIDAIHVFDDYNYVERETKRNNEERIEIIGKVESILFVVYVNRSFKKRIISARKANLKERKYYEFINAKKPDRLG